MTTTTVPAAAIEELAKKWESQAKWWRAQSNSCSDAGYMYECNKIASTLETCATELLVELTVPAAEQELPPIPYGHCDECGFSTLGCTCEENAGRARELPPAANAEGDATPSTP